MREGVFAAAHSSGRDLKIKIIRSSIDDLSTSENLMKAFNKMKDDIHCQQYTTPGFIGPYGDDLTSALIKTIGDDDTFMFSPYT